MAPATALGAALKTLASSRAREQRLGANAKASILYDARDAADVDRETIHAVGVRGFEELCRRDGRFEAFAKTLFSRARAEAGHRESEDAETSRATSVELRAYLRLLSGYFTEKCAVSTLEYLVRRFKIHVYDVDDFIACALPWHSTAEFVKCAQTCQLENSKNFKWLSGVKETGAAPPRDALAVRCSKDKAFFSFCAESATEMATAKVRERRRETRLVFSSCFFCSYARSFSTANGTSNHDRGHSCESRHVMDRHSRWYMYSFKEAPALSAFAPFARNVLRSAVARIA